MSPEGQRGFTGEVVLRGDDAIVDARTGGYVYRIANVRSRSAGCGQPMRICSRACRCTAIPRWQKSGDLVFVRELSFDRGTQVINVFRANASTPGTYAHVAVLAPRGGGPIIESFDVSGNIVIASGAETAYIFELPASLTTPTPRQDNFESGNAASWSTHRGLAVFGGGERREPHLPAEQHRRRGARPAQRHELDQPGNRSADHADGVRRQRSMGRPRHTLPGRAELLLRHAAQLGQRAIASACVPESFSTIASTALPVTLNRRYRVRLESIGSVHRVYVNGDLLLDADDAGAPLQGSAGLIDEPRTRGFRQRGRDAEPVSPRSSSTTSRPASVDRWTS